jgi:hypothetical protein
MTTATASQVGPLEDPRYRLAFDEAVRTLDHQEAGLDNLRARSGMLLAALSVVTSFLGAAAIGAHGVGPMAFVGIVTFAAAGVVLVGLLWPRANWKWRFSPERIIADYVEGDDPADVNAMYRDLALHLGDNHDDNQTRIDRMWLAFEVACLLLVVEVVVWILALAHL